MKIQIQNDYKSIQKSEEEFKIPDFTILTGKNGSGKTHFLKAIQRGAVKIQDALNDSHIYFDYTNFLVSDNQDTKNMGDAIKRRKLTSYQKKKNSIVKKACNNIRNSDIDGWGQHTDMYESNKNTYNQDPADRLGYHHFMHEGQPGDYDKLYNHQKAIEYMEEELEKEKIYQDIKYLEEKHKMKIHNMQAFHIPNEIPFVKGEFIDYVSNWEKERYNAIHDENKDSEKEKRTYETKIIDPLININKNLKTLGYGHFEVTRTNPIKSPEEYSGHKSDIKLLKDGTDIAPDIAPVIAPDINPDIAPDSLSSGEKIFFGLAVFLSNKKNLDSKVLLLDEIDATLHPSMSRTLLNALKKLQEEKGLKIILATHSPSTVAFANEDEICVIDNEKPNNLIECTKKQTALDIITEGIVTVSEKTKIVIVEGCSKKNNGSLKSDEQFYNSFYEMCVQQGQLPTHPTLMFRAIVDSQQKGKKKVNGSKTQVKAIQEAVERLDITNTFAMMDADSDAKGNKYQAEDKSIKIPRYCIENYQYDPVALVFGLCKNGYWGEDNSATLIQKSDKLQDRINTALKKIEKLFSQSEDILLDAEKVSLDYIIGDEELKINIPKWYLVTSGKTLEQYINSYIESLPKNEATTSFRKEDIETMLLRHKIIPKCLLETFKYIINKA